MSVSFTTTGSFDKTDRFLAFLKGMRIQGILEQYGQQGVAALAAATPERTGLTAASWDFEVQKSGGDYKLIWTNSHVNEGVAIAVLIQYGHGTGTGGYVQGYDFINPAMRPVFDSIANNVWKAVTSA
jgi:hypothetical protein